MGNQHVHATSTHTPTTSTTKSKSTPTTSSTTKSNFELMNSMSAITTRNDWQLSAHEPENSSKLDHLSVNASYRTQKRRSSLLIVTNGITGKFISSRICKIAAKFWRTNVETLSHADQLEISCSIFFGIMSTNKEMQKFMKSRLALSHSMQSATAKYLDMVGWLIRHLVTDNIDLYALLDKLGAFHRQMGITIRHFPPMLEALHDTFAYYFKNKYNIEVKYALDEIFSFTAQIMTGQNLQCSAYLHEITKQFEEADIPFLEDLSICLRSSIGREYLYRHLSQTWCDEMVLFLKSVQRFKHLNSDRERFFAAREINKHSIDAMATFTLNLSHELRTQTLEQMAQLEAKFTKKEVFTVPTTLYDEIEREVHCLIRATHWLKFVHSVKALQAKSFDVKYMD